jgi:hypothetical protein
VVVDRRRGGNRTQRDARSGREPGDHKQSLYSRYFPAQMLYRVLVDVLAQGTQKGFLEYWGTRKYHLIKTIGGIWSDAPAISLTCGVCLGETSGDREFAVDGWKDSYQYGSKLASPDTSC